MSVKPDGGYVVLLPRPATVHDVRNAILLCSAVLLPLGGCALGDFIVGEARPDEARAAAPFYDYSTFFRAFDNPWVGRSRDDLVAVLGPPDAMFEARHQFADFDAGIPAVTYIYVGAGGAAGSCIDAFVVDEPTKTVIKYYCR